MNLHLQVLSLFFLLLSTSCGSLVPPSHRFLSDTDNSYRYLEAKQELAYRKASSGQKSAWNQSRSKHPELGKCDPTLTTLPQAMTWITGYPPVTSQNAFTQLSVCLALNRGITTRYEILSSYIPSRLLLEVLTRVAKSQKSLVVPEEVRLGTLPILSINARTLEVPKTQESIIIMDKGAFELASRFTEFALSTIWVRGDDETVVKDTQIGADPVFGGTPGNRFYEKRRPDVDYSEQTYYDMYPVQSPIWLQNYTLAFLSGEDDHLDQSRCKELWNVEMCQKRSLGPYKQRLLTAMVQAMGLFVLGHELTHVMMDHKSIEVKGLQTGDDQPTTKSWRDEIDADKVGAALMVKAIKEFGLDFGDPLIQAYQLAAPLLFLEYVRIVDDAKYALENRKELTEIDLYDLKDIVSAYSEAIDTGDETLLLREFGYYPPTWLRSTILEAQLFRESRLATFSEEQRYYADLGKSLKIRMRQLARIMNSYFAAQLFSRQDVIRMYPLDGIRKNKESPPMNNPSGVPH